MENLNVNVGRILANDWNKSFYTYEANSIGLKPQSLETKPKTDTISVKCEFEKYDNPVVEIVEGEIVVKLGKVKIGGVK